MNMLLVLLLSFTTLASDIPTTTVERLRRLYPDQSESFLQKRLETAVTAQEKWTAFPPYFYDLVNRLGLQLNSRQGFCAGDAHIENFGYLYAKEAKFTINDLDDAANCALDADALRLYIGHKLLHPVEAKSWLASYEKGLLGGAQEKPSALLDLRAKSEKGNRKLAKKFAKLLTHQKCDGDYQPLTSAEFSNLRGWSVSRKKTLVHACSRLKVSGGSAGQKRFVVFEEDDAFELKPLVTPAPLYNKTISQPERMKMFNHSVEHFLGADYTQDYFPVSIGSKLYQRRPLFAGNEPVEAGELSHRDLQEVIFYEAYYLGKLHGVSTRQRSALDHQSWESHAKKIETLWRSEFAE